MSEAGCPEHSLCLLMPQPLSEVEEPRGDGQERLRASGELRSRGEGFPALPHRYPAAWLGEAGVGQCPALRASHHLVPACVSAALGADRGAAPGWFHMARVRAIEVIPVCISRDPGGQDQINEAPILALWGTSDGLRF